MQSGKIAHVNVARTWDLVCRHRIYSRPADTHTDISDADFLLLKRGSQNQTMKVVGFWKFNPRGDRPQAVPIEWLTRLEDYIADIASARDLGGILDQPGDYFFYCLARDDDDYEEDIRAPGDNDSWPNRLRAMTGKRDLVDQAAIALWREKDSFFRWPHESALLWQGVTRRQGGYSYPDEIRCLLGREPDQRNNGPAIHAFELSGEKRPDGWHVHHVYDGSVSIPGTSKPIVHAVNHPDYFTHSGGLVAAHPAAHFVAHESELLGWLLRWEAFKRLKFDPDNIFRGCK